MNRFLPDRLRNSLLLRLGGMFVAITVLAVTSMSTSWIVAETTQGSGQAINVAGSLRMQSWRMASIQQHFLQNGDPAYRKNLEEAIGRFESDLRSEPILAVLPYDDTAPLFHTYGQIEFAAAEVPVADVGAQAVHHLRRTGEHRGALPVARHQIPGAASGESERQAGLLRGTILSIAASQRR